MYSCLTMSELDNTGGGENLGLSRYLQLLILIACVVYIFFLLPDIKSVSSTNPLLKYWIIVFIYLTLLLIFLQPLQEYTVLGWVRLVIQYFIHLSLLCTMYLYARRNGISNMLILVCFGIMLVLVLQYSRIYFIANQMGTAHIAMSYYPLFLLPIVLLHPWKIIRFSSTLIVMVVLFSSMKRGGIVAFVLAMLAYVLIRAYVSNAKKIRTYVGLLFTLMIFVAMFVWLGTQENNTIFERFMNIQDDGGSGRVDVWILAWKMITQSQFIDFMMGHGHLSLMKDSYIGLAAHNDLLEVWYDYGFIALVMYLIVYYNWFRQCMQLSKQKNILASNCFMLATITIIIAMISHVIIYPWMTLIMMELGGVLGLLDREYEKALYAK